MDKYTTIAKLESYANDRAEDKDVLKKLALMMLKENEITKESLENIIEKSFKIGHYVGHCRGEAYVRKVYDLGIYE
jgi:hypothetical protein